MKKLTLVLLLCLTLAFTFASCEEQDGSVGGGQNQPEHTHSFGEWETTTNPTCTEKGENARYCSCGEKQTDVVVEKGHNFIDGVCQNCGETREQPTIHEHIPAEAVEENFVDATCHSVGKKDIVVYCSVEDCDVEIYRTTQTIELKAHTISEPVEENRVEPTFEQDGSYEMVIYCDVSECRAELSREKFIIDMMEHHPGAMVVENIVSASCTQNGSYDEVVYCLDDNCGHKELSRKTVTTEKLSHTPGEAVRENEIAATCTVSGSYEEVVYCTSCSVEINRTKGITPTKAHNYVNDVCVECETPRVSEGLAFTSNGDGTCYVSGIGTCTDTDIVIPPVSTNSDIVTSIASGAFSNCSVTDITIPDTVISINSYAFANCSFLKNIIIPDSVDLIGESAFHGCSSLESITLPFVGGNRNAHNTDAQLFGYIFGTKEYTGGLKTQQHYLTTIKPSGSSGSPCDVTYYIPERLTSVTITGESVYFGAFYACSNITNITLINVDLIGTHAFYGCTNLKNLSIDGATNTIAANILYNASVPKIYYVGTAEDWNLISIDVKYNTNLNDATRYYYSETEPTTEGNFWHYVDGVPTPW